MTQCCKIRTHSSVAISETHQTRPSHFKIGHSEDSFVDGLTNHSHVDQDSCISLERLHQEPSYADSSLHLNSVMFLARQILLIALQEAWQPSSFEIIPYGGRGHHGSLMANSIEIVDSWLKSSWVMPKRFTLCGSTDNRLPLGSDSQVFFTHQIISHYSSSFYISIKGAKTAKQLTSSNHTISWHGMAKTLLGQGNVTYILRTRTQSTQGSLTLTKDAYL